MEKAIRLDKYLADMGKGTRTELKEMIRKGRITVNGMIIKSREKRARIDVFIINTPNEDI